MQVNTIIIQKNNDMHTIIERVLTGRKMLGIFNQLNNKEFSVKSYHVDGISEEDFNPKQPYNFIICIRHPEGTSAGSLFDKKYKASLQKNKPNSDHP
jgi:hypothetical protein